LCGTRVGRGKVRSGAGSSYNLFNCWNFVGPLGLGGPLTASLGLEGAIACSTEGVEGSVVVVCAVSAMVMKCYRGVMSIFLDFESISKVHKQQIPLSSSRSLFCNAQIPL